MTGQDEARNLIWDIKMRGHDIDHAISTGLLATAVEDTIIALEQIAAEWERVKLSLEALDNLHRPARGQDIGGGPDTPEGVF